MSAVEMVNKLDLHALSGKARRFIYVPTKENRGRQLSEVSGKVCESQATSDLSRNKTN